MDEIATASFCRCDVSDVSIISTVHSDTTGCESAVSEVEPHDDVPEAAIVKRTGG